MPADFKWPCSKREAHGPHMIKEPIVGKGLMGALPVLRGFRDVECPGVRAHPNTMIGRVGVKREQ